MRDRPVCRWIVLLAACASAASAMAQAAESRYLRVEVDDAAGTLNVYQGGAAQPLLTQHARPDFRPYIHPIVAPDGRGVLTEAGPQHHPHQTGLYWGFTRVNGRDYFHHPAGDHWRRVSVTVLKESAASAEDAVQWQTVYDLLDESGAAVLAESQIWTMRVLDGSYVLDLQWMGEAKTDVTIGKYDYGGLFLRMPWREGIPGQVINSARQNGSRAEGQRAVWVDVGMQVAGRDDLAHIAIFAHPANAGFPQAWRVDSQMGVGPVRVREEDWQLVRGERALIRHQLVVYTGALNDVALTEKWSAYTGQELTSAEWRLAQREGRQAEFLDPNQAAAAMTLREGFQAGVFAAEPMITQSMAFCWDDRGRMWVAENRDYESRGTGFSSFGDSRILILEDTDGDGVADDRKVFLEGIPFPAAIAVGFGGLWLGAPPNLLFVPDADGDDRADLGNIEVRLTGWGIRDRHETLNSLHWGPDGWLYGCQGFATPSRVGKPAGQGRIYRHNEPFPSEIELEDEGVEINGGVWRYHPTKQRFEVVAHGFSNPWGIDYDAKGQLFVTACVIPHLWHVVPGGIYHRQGGSHFNPYVYRDIQTIADHRHRSAHGGARFYLSDAFPDQYNHRLFMANIHEHAVLTDVLERHGSGFVGRHGDDFLLANNAQWIGFSIEIGPEGAVYVLDWHDADICGTDVLNKDTARIFRITPSQSRAAQWEGRYADLRTLGNADLVRLQLSSSAWHARRARLLLQERAARGTIDDATRAALWSILRAEMDADHRLRALWALQVTESLDESSLNGLLRDADEYLRAWSIQLLCEDRSPSAATLEEFARLAGEDASAAVRLYLAAALQRMPHSSRWPILRALSRRSEDAADHNIPRMIWFALEPLAAEDPEQAIELAVSSQIPLLSEHIARRLTDADQLEAVVAAVGRTAVARRELLAGMLAGLEGRYDVQAPANWPGVWAALERQGGASARLASRLAQRFADTAVAERMLAALDDERARDEDRRQALLGLAARRRPELRSRLVRLLEVAPLRGDAIRAIAAFDDNRLGRALLSRYRTFTPEEKLEAIQTLAARPGYGRRLTDAIRRGEVPRRDVPAYVARSLRRVVGVGFVDVWGPLDEQSLDQEANLTKYRTLLTDAALDGADARQGRAVFNRTCLACHQLYGEGGQVGPDITGANRTDLEYLLGNILTPSAVIQDNYRMNIVLTDDGRVYSGIPAGEDQRQLRLYVANQPEPVAIPKSQIESREIAPVSMMPEGLLNTLNDTEVLNLVAYLRRLEQVAMPEGN